MQPIFISYSSKHRDLTRELAEVIEAQYGTGSVWWDHALESRASYSEQIKAALEKARVVVVIWTAGAMVSDYVYAEAVRALEQGKLVNVRPADMSFRDIPEPFNIHHIDEVEDPARILSTIDKVMTGIPIPTRVPLHEIYYRQHGHRLIDPKQSTLAADTREISPSELLQARFGVVGYVDVSGIRVDLLDWCTGGGRRSGGRLVHGAGGLGKTRVLIEVAAELRQRGWFAGFFERPHEQDEVTLKQRWQALDQLIAYGEDDGLLIVIDYAEGRQDEVRRVAERLNQRPESDTRSIRVVALARSAGEWWMTLHEDDPEVQRLFRGSRLAPDVIAIEEIDSARQRLELFQASLRAFGPPLAAQGYVPPTGAPSAERLQRIETGAAYARPLAVQMEALLWLVAAAPELGAPVDELLRRVLGFERSHWKKLLGTLDQADVRDMARGVAQVTAVHGVPSRGSAERLLMADDFYQGQRTARVAVDPVVRNLSRVYGRPDEGLAHLEPDLIGEHHVATVGDVELFDGCLRWIETEPPDAQEQRRRDLVTVLQRATQPEHGADVAKQAITLLDHLIKAHLKPLAAAIAAAMIDSPGALAERLRRRIDTLDDESLGAIDSALPIKSLSLMDLSLHVALRRAALARELLAAANAAGDETGEPRQRILHHVATNLGTLGIRLSHLGRHEEALAASQEAVDIRRRLAASSPEAFLPDLALSLNNLCGDLSDLGRHEEALAASQEAVDLYRRLAASRPDAFLPELAGGLNNLGGTLCHLGRRGEALAASQEAVDIRRRLAASRPEAILPDLAMSLNNLGIHLSDLGRHEEALAASQEAVDLYRRLAASRPDALLPDLAMGLNNLGTRLSRLGRREEALVANQETVDLYRRLAASRPDAFLPHLATGLNNLGTCLSSLGRTEEALVASQETVDIRRRTEANRLDAFLPDLAGSLNNLGENLSRLGRHEEALAASQEAVDLYRRLAASRPDAFLPNLALSISVMSDILASLNRRTEAAIAAQQSLEILAPFVERYPETFGDLARTMGGDLLRYREAAGHPPDVALLERVARALGGTVGRE